MMSVRVEWTEADTLAPELLQPGEEAPDHQYADVIGNYTLLLGGGDPLAVTGTRAELEDALQHALAVVRGEA
jgi:hypothetical protein